MTNTVDLPPGWADTLEAASREMAAASRFPSPPSVGRTVHFVGETGICMAAIIVAVYETTVGLTVFTPLPVFVDHVEQDELPPPSRIVAGERSTYRVGTWHWPERT